MQLSDITVRNAKPKEKMLALGTYSEVSLSEALAKRHEARRLLAQNSDPAEQKKETIPRIFTTVDSLESLSSMPPLVFYLCS